jgi:hypothetical protein
VGDIDFLVISATENSNKFPKTRFWKEKSVENVAILVSTGHTSTKEHTIFINIMHDDISVHDIHVAVNVP